MTDATALAQKATAENKTRIAQLDPLGLDLLFREARSHSAWQDRPVGDDQLRALYEVVKMGPTTVNSCPARILFLRTPEAKARLKPALSPSNVDKTMTAPVTAIIGYDTRFFEHLPRLFPHKDVKGNFADNPEHAEKTAFRNGTLQGAYLMIAARALGLDIGAMSGFDNEKVDQEFFKGTPVKSNFLLNLGYGDPEGIMVRNPRFDFEEVCEFL